MQHAEGVLLAQGWQVVRAGARKAGMRLRVTYGLGRPQRPSEDSWLTRSPLARRFMGRGSRRVRTVIRVQCLCQPPLRG